MCVCVCVCVCVTPSLWWWACPWRSHWACSVVGPLSLEHLEETESIMGVGHICPTAVAGVTGGDGLQAWPPPAAEHQFVSVTSCDNIVCKYICKYRVSQKNVYTL